MKNRWIVAPCGAMHKFREWGYSDLATPKIRKILISLPPAHKRALYNPDNVGRKPKMWAERVTTSIVRAITAGIMDELEKGNRVVLEHKEGHAPLIMRLGYHHKPLKNLHRGVFESANRELLLDGIPHNYYFRVVGRRITPIRKRDRAKLAV